MRHREKTAAALACILASALAACLSFGDLSGGNAAPADAGLDAIASDAAAAIDSSPASDGGIVISTPDGSCAFDSKFGAPVSLASINSPVDDWAARLTPDELTLYFGSVRAPRADSGVGGIFSATRGTVTGNFGNVTLLKNVNTASYANYPSVTADGLSLFFETNATPHTSIYASTRTTTTEDFGAPGIVGGINVSTLDQNAPFIMPSGIEIYFSQSAPGGGIRSILHSSISGGSFAAPVAESELNNPSFDSTYPVVTPDNLTIFFATTNSAGAGLSDIWKANRASTADAFSNIQPVAEINSAYGDFPSWLSPDACTLYLFTNRAAAGAANGLDLYVAERGK